MRIGNGYDLHRLVAGRPLILGGVTIPFEKGLEGHSDADAVCHAVTDAILGAAGAGDIGRHFPDTDAQWKDANSIRLLEHAAGVVAKAGYRVVNVDVDEAVYLALSTTNDQRPGQGIVHLSPTLPTPE